MGGRLKSLLLGCEMAQQYIHPLHVLYTTYHIIYIYIYKYPESNPPNLPQPLRSLFSSSELQISHALRSNPSSPASNPRALIDIYNNWAIYYKQILNLNLMKATLGMSFPY